MSTTRRARRLLLAAAVAALASAAAAPSASAYFACPGFPHANPSLWGGVCTYGSGDHWGEFNWFRRSNGSSFVTNGNHMAFIDINSTRCGIRWYEDGWWLRPPQWLYLWTARGDYSGVDNGEHWVPTAYRNRMDRGVWTC